MTSYRLHRAKAGGIRIGTHGTMTEKTEKKDIRYCPFCGRTSFELSGEEDDSVYCEHCGVDVKVKELIP
jgi:ribosomal protein L37E